MDLVAGAAIAFVVAALTTPVGVSGAFLLVPVQLSVLGVPVAQVAPTNLLFNVVSIPGALVRYRERIRTDHSLITPLLAGGVPGVVAGVITGVVLRTQFLNGTDAYLIVMAALLAPMGLWLALSRPPAAEASGEPRRVATPTLIGIAFAAGVAGGLYGVGGGSIIAPVLVALGLSVIAVAPAALIVTFVSSVAGLAAFLLLSTPSFDSSPDWPLGIAMGIGGLGGGYLGARIQPRVPERALRVGLGVISVLLAVRYALQILL
ncbi:MAG: sulfite exporter TauE/SafE family protein [Solirubrobacterales bacterium]